jgi:hypothetical protein
MLADKYVRDDEEDEFESGSDDVIYTGSRNRREEYGFIN